MFWTSRVSSGAVCPVTSENKTDLERTEFFLAKLVLQEDYQSYNEALLNLGLINLEDRRKSLTLAFAKRSLADGHFKDLILKIKVDHRMKTGKETFMRLPMQTQKGSEILQ